MTFAPKEAVRESMDAAERAALGVTVPVAVPAAAPDVLRPIVRLACRVVEADEAVVLVRGARDPRALLPIAWHRSGTYGVAELCTDDPLLERALGTGAPAAGEVGGRLRAAAPIAWGGIVRGVLAATGSGSGRIVAKTELEALQELAELAAVALEQSAYRVQLEEIVDAGVAGLARAVDMRDGSTGRHSESVSELARGVGERLGMSATQLWRLELAARLHDVGKIGIPDAILKKPGPLDAAEWRLMRRHAEMGARMVANVPGLETVARVVRSHHERWDGRGYPDGLRGDAIPLASRVIAACDAFQAMTNDRPYRGALDAGQAVAELLAGAGSQFDPKVVDALCAERAPERAA